jgi:hypothetical protein
MPTFLEARFARRNDVTFVDLVLSPDDNESDRAMFGWHVTSAHTFSVMEIARDSLVMNLLEGDSVNAMLKRAPKTLDHVIDGDRVVLTAPTRRAQAFLMDVSRKRGYTQREVYHRLRDNVSCEELSGGDSSIVEGTYSDQMLRRFGVFLNRGEGPTVTLAAKASVLGFDVREAGLVVVHDTATSTAGSRVTLSEASRLAVITDQRTMRRLELRWAGVTPTGGVKVRAHECHDGFASSSESREKLPAPTTTVRFEGDSANHRVIHAWRSMPGATWYEVLLADDGEKSFRYPARWQRFVVRDTSFVRYEPIVERHTWRVRAFAPGIGFGPLSTVSSMSSSR